MSGPIRGKNCSPFSPGDLWSPRLCRRSLLAGAVTGRRLRGRSLSRRASWETLNPETDELLILACEHKIRHRQREIQVLAHYCFCFSVSRGPRSDCWKLPAVLKSYLSQAAIGVVVSRATVRAVAAPRLLLFV